MTSIEKATTVARVALPEIRSLGGARLAAIARKAGEFSLSFVLLVTVLEAALRFFEVPPYIFPAPSTIGEALWRGLANGSYLQALGITLIEILSGLALGGG